MPDVVQQGQGHFTGGRVNGQGEVIHPTGAAGDDVAHLIEHDGRALAVGGQRVDRIQTARHVGAAQRQAVADAALPIRPEGRRELGLYVGRTQTGTGHPVTANAAQTGQAFIHGCPQTRGFFCQPGTRAVILEAEHTVGAQVYRCTGAVTISVGHGLHQRQHALTHSQCHAVICIGGVAMPDVVQQGQGHFTGGRVNGQGEVIHPTGAAGDDVAHLIEHDGRALAVGGQRVDRIQTARHVGAAQRQAVADAALPIRPEGRRELGLYVGRTQTGTGHPVTANAAQTGQTFIHACTQTRGFFCQPGTRAVIVKVEYRTLAIYQTNGGAVCDAIPISIHPGYAVLQTQSVLAAQQQ